MHKPNIARIGYSEEKHRRILLMMFRNKNEIELSESQFDEPAKPRKFHAMILKIGKRNAIIACAVLLIGAAVFLNWVLFTGNNTTDGYGGYDQPSGNISNPSDSTNTQLDESRYIRWHSYRHRQRKGCTPKCGCYPSASYRRHSGSDPISCHRFESACR
jgi:hypothetical protein